MLIHYESDPDAIRAALPEPLEPDGNHVIFEWMKMLDSSGFGSYQESGIGMRPAEMARPATTAR
ncbi:MAG TPA: acetoacetate decarboxylase family protein [Acetobacteraceae bacterium]|nr:acetoacetate decarboxylase family protein [Acetobacteraceae bacterium]